MIKDKILQHFYSYKCLFPFLAWLPELKQKRILKADIFAGITVAMLMIPQSMAYAHLAGLPVNYGLYAAFIPPFIAALFGSSRILSTGPVPVSTLLTVVALQPIAAIGTPTYIQYVVLLTLLAGIIQFLLGLLRFGVVVNFISYPVILGFINAVAIIIASMQLGNLFGVYATSAPSYYQTVWQVLMDAVENIHWQAVGMAFITFVIILGGRRFAPKWPHTIMAVIVTTLLAWLLHYEKLEEISPKQIINPSVQEMIKHQQTYSKDIEKLIKKVADNEAALEKISTDLGGTSETAENALNEMTQAKWALKRFIERHIIENNELNRLRFSRLINKNQIFYYVADEMSPIGISDTTEWSIARVTSKGNVILRSGGEVIGSITPGLPTFQPVVFDWNVITTIFAAALVIAIVGFTEAITIAKRIATETRQRLNVNQELLGQGLAKIVGSFFQSMPVSGGFTRTAVNFYAGAQTGFASVVASIVVMLALVWFTPLFYYLPYATLAAIIMIGALNLLNIKEIGRVWKISKKEGVVTLFTLLLTLILAPRLAQAVLISIILSLGIYLYDTMRPRFSELIRTKEGDLVEEITPEEQQTCYLISLVRFNGSLYFANAAYFEDKILNLISVKHRLRYIILDCVSMNKIDASGIESLSSVFAKLQDAGIELWFTRVRPPILIKLKRSGLYEKIGEENFFRKNDDALKKLEKHLGAKHVNTCPLFK